MNCPYHHKLREGLPPLSPRIARLPLDERGYPVPFFVSWVKGAPEFRLADPAKLDKCLKLGLCWVCGEPLERTRTFPIGPMCSITRTTADPASHPDCAEWSVKGCPFLSKPQMVRRVDELTLAHNGNVAGVMIDRNPGVTCLWTTKSFRLFQDGRGGRLIEVGRPISVTWWREGRPATRLEVEESMATGLPKLLEHCHCDEDRAELAQQVARAKQFLPST